jgi:hypothetical protein
MTNITKCPFCKGSGYAVDVFEDDFIAQKLLHFITDLKTDKSREELVDIYACAITSYINGRLKELIRKEGV